MSDIDIQIKRVLMLSHLVGEKLTDYQQDRKDFRTWRKENPDKETWCYYKANKTTPAEIKRAMMILREETIKLGKML